MILDGEYMALWTSELNDSRKFGQVEPVSSAPGWKVKILFVRRLFEVDVLVLEVDSRGPAPWGGHGQIAFTADDRKGLVDDDAVADGDCCRGVFEVYVESEEMVFVICAAGIDGIADDLQDFATVQYTDHRQ